MFTDEELGAIAPWARYVMIIEFKTGVTYSIFLFGFKSFYDSAGPISTPTLKFSLTTIEVKKFSGSSMDY